MLVGGCCAISQDPTQTWDSRELLFAGEGEKRIPSLKLTFRPLKMAFLKGNLSSNSVSSGCECVSFREGRIQNKLEILGFAWGGWKKYMQIFPTWWWKMVMNPRVRIHKKSPTRFERLWITTCTNHFCRWRGQSTKLRPFKKMCLKLFSNVQNPEMTFHEILIGLQGSLYWLLI